LEIDPEADQAGKSCRVKLDSIAGKNLRKRFEERRNSK
jgi:hypothetical protein